MADNPDGLVPIDNEDIEETPGYQPPKEKSLKDIQDLDRDDEALVKYKAQLLAGANDVLDEGGLNVLVKKLALKIKDREDVVIDLTGDISSLKERPIVIKEGSEYQVEISFRVQREIVAGLRYFQVISRKGIKVDKNAFMVGSYGPKSEIQTYKTPVDTAPNGMMSRGHYTVKSKFTDDDKHIYLEWEWSFDIKKDWS
ncbi:rho GDP-dissociation inhibitor 1-like [Xenia sp. Carnegie-2017]|uniref:rho GDP-dissociation inhibitor 1-like n=1 Tax=Xenia sp. Carnegie-2017 TaxID=2897299 RepID=UPI001F0472B4|nr:rho GDP-dissociation inhibitor 1-like [Xenia sp. Carnegie-2017]